MWGQLADKSKIQLDSCPSHGGGGQGRGGRTLFLPISFWLLHGVALFLISVFVSDLCFFLSVSAVISASVCEWPGLFIFVWNILFLFHCLCVAVSLLLTMFLSVSASSPGGLLHVPSSGWDYCS